MFTKHSIFLTTLFLLIEGAAFAQEDETSLSVEYKAKIAARVIELLNEEYVLPDKAVIAAAEVKRRLEAGDYDEINDLQTFANRLTGTLDIIDDWHLGVNYYPEPISEDYDYWDQSEEEIAERLESLRIRNYGFEKVERLPGNIGYINFRDFFYEAPFSENTIASVMQFVEHTDGLIIDLRKNGGGQAASVQLFISYLMDQKILIGTTQYRKNNRAVEFWTLDDVSGPRYPMNNPVFLVISKSTFSAAEAFVYAMQSLERVTVFGEETIGGAHPTDNMRLDEHLMMRMPVATSIDPRTGGNWQYVGIQPDHVVDAENALDLAYRTMLKDLIINGEEGAARSEKDAALTQLESDRN